MKLQLPLGGAGATVADEQLAFADGSPAASLIQQHGLPIEHGASGDALSWKVVKVYALHPSVSQHLAAHASSVGRGTEKRSDPRRLEPSGSRVRLHLAAAARGGGPTADRMMGLLELLTKGPYGLSDVAIPIHSEKSEPEWFKKF